MLHIIKQFMFGLKLGIKSDFDNGDQFTTTMNNLDSSNEEEAKLATFKMSKFFTDLDADQDNTITADEKGKSVITTEVMNSLFKKLGLRIRNESDDLLLDRVNNSLIKYQENREINIKDSQLSRVALNSEILDLTPDKFSDAIVDDTLIQKGFDTINKRGSFNKEVIGNYLHNGEQNEIIMKKDGKGSYYIELDNSVSGWGNDIVSETTKIQSTDKVEELVQSITSGNIFGRISEKGNSFDENNEEENTIVTKEKGATGSQERFLGIKYDNLDKQEVLGEVNMHSLSQLLVKTSDVSQLVSELKEALGTDSISGFTYTNVLGIRNYSKALTILEREGYDVSRYFGTVEAKGVIGTINGVNETQKLIQNMNFKDKLGIIFDYNADGLLDSEGEFYTEEKEIFNAVETEVEYENILKNLGYADKAQFDTEFNENYYVAREKFKNLLAISLSGKFVLNPGLMMSNPEAKAQLNTQLQIIDEKVKGDISMSEKAQKLSNEYPTLAPQIQENVTNIAKSVYLQSISGVVGGATGAVVTFDISGITEEILDTASFGIVGGYAGIQFGKEFFRSYDNKTSASLGMVNFIPYIAVTHEAYNEKVSGLHSLFQTGDIENGSVVTVGGGLSKGAGMIGINFEKVDEKTSRGREQLKQQMGRMLTKVLDNISTDGSFDDLILKDSQNEENKGLLKDTPENRDYYEQIKALYLATGANKIAQDEIITGAANNYERVLSQLNEGFEITGITLGLVYTVLTGVIPTIGGHAEVSSVDWEKRRFVIDKIEPVVVDENAGEIYESTENNTEYILNELQVFESGFSEKTRWNSGAKEFLNPLNSINDRWEGLKELAKWPKALQEVKLLEYLESKNDISDEVKLSIISLLGAWTRRSEQVKVSDTPTKLVEMDRQRREGFNNNFGFNTAEYAENYYNQLEQLDTIDKTVKYGSSFDALSILHVGSNEKISGIDMLHGPLEMVADSEKNPLRVKIDNSDHIKDFANSIKPLAINNGTKMQELIQMIEEGKVDLYFYKDPDGFNDRIMPVMKETPVVITKINEQKSVGVNNPVFDVTPISLFAIPHQSSENNSNEHNGEVKTQTGNDTNGNLDTTIDTGNDGFGSQIDNPDNVIPKSDMSSTSRTHLDLKNAGTTILTQDIEAQNKKYN